MLAVKDNRLLVLDMKHRFLQEIKYYMDTFIYTMDKNASKGEILIYTLRIGHIYYFRIRKEGTFKEEYDNMCEVLSSLKEKL